MRIQILASALALTALSAAAPASAQLFWKPVDYSGAPLAGYAPDLLPEMPGAQQLEQDAGIAWHMRAALNVAALQCGFEPTLRTLPTYNALIKDHEAELAKTFQTLTGYFKRTAKTPALGQKALDTYGTRVYSAYSTVNAQLDFCMAAGKVGRKMLFTPKGGFVKNAREYLRTLRSGLKLSGERQFPGMDLRFRLPRPSLEERCWKKNRYDARCG